MRHIRLAIAALSAIVVYDLARAQELEPRAYANTPVDLNFLISGYAHAQGDVLTDPSLPIKDAQLQSNTFVLAYARALDVWGKSGKIDFILPCSELSGSASVAGTQRSRSVTGFGDPRLRFSVNFYGAPALTMKEFESYRQSVIVGASLQLAAPLGQYDTTKLANIGTNRWYFKPDIGISKKFSQLTVELTTGVYFFTSNDEFLGNNTREEDPLYSVQTHVIYGFGRGLWAALDGTYYRGGRTTINGKENDDELESSRLGATLALPVNKYNALKLYASTGLTNRRGGDFTIGGIAWQCRWGGGL